MNKIAVLSSVFIGALIVIAMFAHWVRVSYVTFFQGGMVDNAPYWMLAVMIGAPILVIIWVVAIIIEWAKSQSKARRGHD